MVTYTDPRLSIGEGLYHPSASGRFAVPAAFSPLAVKWSAASCSDHPDPGTATARVFVPDHHTLGTPELFAPLTFSASINGDSYRAGARFAGVIDRIKSTYAPGPAAPVLIPNSREMTDATGWAAWTAHEDGTDRVPVGWIAGEGALITTYFDDLASTDPAARFCSIQSPHVPMSNIPGPGRLTFSASHPWPSTTMVRIDYYDGAGAALSSYSIAAETPHIPGVFFTGDIVAPSVVVLPTAPPPPAAGAATARFTVQIPLSPNTGEHYPVRLEALTLWTTRRGPFDPLTPARPAGTFYEVSASDAAAAAGRLRVGFKPRPAERFGARNLALNASVPNRDVVSFWQPDDGSRAATMMGPLDVDNQSPLEVFRRMAAAAGLQAMASPGDAHRVICSQPYRMPTVLTNDAGAAALVRDPEMPAVPASAVIDSAQLQAIDTMANQITIGYRTYPDQSGTTGTGKDAETTLTDAAGMGRYGPMIRRIDTDLGVIDGQAPAGYAIDRAHRQIEAQSRPYRQLADGVQLAADQLGGDPAISNLFTSLDAFGALVEITDAPAGVSQYHRINGASLTFGAEIAATLSVEPADNAGASPVLVGELGDVFGPGTLSELTISDFATITSDDVRGASAQK